MMRALVLAALCAARASAGRPSYSSRAAFDPSQRQSVGLWPLPTTATSGTSRVTVDASKFAFTIKAGASSTLTAVANRYLGLIFLHGGRGNVATHVNSNNSTAGAITGCTVQVAAATEDLSWGMDESYELVVGAAGDNCAITAGTFVGAMYAMETLSQLVLSDGGALTGVQGPSYWVEGAPWTIKDAPRFPYRGLMLDTARHYLPLNALRRQIDGMSFSKMNALHWHITDAQSTPLDSQVYPKLKMGAFSPKAIYTIADIKGIVEYARLRGVQVLMEVDMPGHNFAFGIGYPELLVNCTSMYPLETEFWTSSFDLSRGEALYSWLEKLLGELTAILPSTLFHIGGDEVQYQCWESDPKMVAYLKSRNMTGVKLYQEFEARMFKMLKGLGKDTVTWDSTWQTGMKIPDGSVVHDYQGGNQSVARIAKDGVKVIVSSLGGQYVASQASWASIFVEEVMPQGLTPAEEKNVLGAAAAMWGETMDDSDVDTIVWPDTCAVAERTWSQPASVNPQAMDTAAALKRLIPHRCRLYQRGVRAKPLDDRDGFGRRRLQAQCETILPDATAAALPPLSFINEGGL